MSTLADVRSSVCQVVGDASGTIAGTGFFVLPGGFLLTCHHVVFGLDELRVLVPGERQARSATYLPDQSDPAVDLALLRVEGPVPAAVQVARARGQTRVYGVGYRPSELLAEPKAHTFPGQLDPGQSLRLPVAVVSSASAARPWNQFTGEARESVVFNFGGASQLEQGISGGPVYDLEQRKVVGIFRAVEGQQSAYVIPIDTVLARWPELAIENAWQVPDAALDGLNRDFGIRLVAEGARPVSGKSDQYFRELIGRHKVFGGRDAEFARLNGFASGDTGGYLFVTGPSGLGKSALLANWAVDLQRRGVRRAVHFITPRIDPSESFFLNNLCAELLAFHGLGGDLPNTERDLRVLYQQLLQLRSANEAKLTLIIDGLDEAHGRWTPEPGPETFIATPSPDLHIVFSARATAGIDWPAQLGLDLPATSRITLGRLDREGIHAAVLRSPLAGLTTLQLDLAVDGLATHSGGDPFYLRDLLRELEAAGGDASVLALFPLEHSAYLQQWWEDGRMQVGAAEFDDLMGLLAAAHGALTRKQLTEICAEDHLKGANIGAVLAAASRYIDEIKPLGYALVHDRIRAFTTQTLGPDMSAFRTRLAKYCERWNEQGLSTEAREYMLRHAIDHLIDAGRGREVRALLGPAWMHAKWEASGSYASLIHDFDAALAALTSGEPDVIGAAALALGRQTARELLLAYPNSLLTVWLRLGLRDRVLQVLATLTDTKGRAIDPLVAVARELLAQGDQGTASDLIGRAIGMLARRRGTFWQLEDLEHIVALLGPESRLTPAGRAQLLASARSFAESQPAPEARAVALALVAAADPTATEVLRQAEEALPLINSPADRFYAEIHLLPARIFHDPDNPSTMARRIILQAGDPFRASSLEQAPLGTFLARWERVGVAGQDVLRELGQMCVSRAQPEGYLGGRVARSLARTGAVDEALALVGALFERSTEAGARALFECIEEVAARDPVAIAKWIALADPLTDGAHHDLQVNRDGYVLKEATALAHLGQWDRAVDLINTTVSLNSGRSSLIDVAGRQRKEATEVVALAERLTGSDARIDAEERARIFAQTALTLIDRDRVAAASAAARAAAACLAELPEGDSDALRILHALARQGEGDDAVALTALKDIRWPSNAIKALRLLMEETDPTDADALMHQAEAVVGVLHLAITDQPDEQLMRDAIALATLLSGRAPDAAVRLCEFVESQAVLLPYTLRLAEAVVRLRLDSAGGKRYLLALVEGIDENVSGEDGMKARLAAYDAVRESWAFNPRAAKALLRTLERGVPATNEPRTALGLTARRASVLALQDCAQGRTLFETAATIVKDMAGIEPPAPHLMRAFSDLIGHEVGQRYVQTEGVKTLAEELVSAAAYCPVAVELLMRLAEQASRIDSDPDRGQALVSLLETLDPSGAEFHARIPELIETILARVEAIQAKPLRERAKGAAVRVLCALGKIDDATRIISSFDDAGTRDEASQEVERARLRLSLEPLSPLERALLALDQQPLAAAVIHALRMEELSGAIGLELVTMAERLPWERHRLLSEWAPLFVPVLDRAQGAGGIAALIDAIEEQDQRFLDTAALVAAGHA